MPANLLIAGTALLALAVAESSSAGSLLRQAVDRAAEGGSTATESTEPEQGKGEDEDSGVEVFWKDGKTYFNMKNAGLELTHRFQFRFNMLDPDDDVLLPGTTERGQAKGSFRIRRAKTTFEGWFWKPELTYELQLSWAGPRRAPAPTAPSRTSTSTGTPREARSSRYASASSRSPSAGRRTRRPSDCSSPTGRC